ncbi:exodeoxyribonuclease III [Kaistella jeonii]|uniref:Exodeoxyribonuclease III n=1 Tax=Kaistella jeonii TaxID=266749 RepID=A0A0C1D169_9FLAO|nr:exodeoxyribonuclease III [Kaistella jeonii]KIA90471.1 exodeoxyribonuclease III [Kaistella jeonii]SFB72370.1 exodeoxyribonuclease-3 [Kaistella jeonii]VEI94962.1 Exodeoxyribonuclease III [Kaistella jeonii]
MKIATYNVNGVNGRLPVLLRWLEESQPDIVCLQELKAPQDKFPEAEILEAGYHSVWLGQKSWNGVAVLSKLEKPVISRTDLPGEDEVEASRYLEVKIKDLIIACIYLPNGNPTPGPKFDYKMRWFERLDAHAEMLITSGKKVLLIGDFNVIPNEKDVYKPEKYKNDGLFLPEVRKAFENLTSQGWTDALRHLYPTETIYTFFDYFRKAYERNAGMRIDHFLLSPEVVPLLKRGKVDKDVRGWEKSSDHCPVWIELENVK